MSLRHRAQSSFFFFLFSSPSPSVVLLIKMTMCEVELMASNGILHQFCSKYHSSHGGQRENLGVGRMTSEWKQWFYSERRVEVWFWGQSKERGVQMKRRPPFWTKALASAAGTHGHTVLESLSSLSNQNSCLLALSLQTGLKEMENTRQRRTNTSCPFCTIPQIFG